MIQEYVDFMAGYVYRDADGYDCTMNGASSRFKRLYVVKRDVTLQDVEELCKKDPKYNPEQFFKVDYKFYECENPVFAGYVRLRPLVKVLHACNMFGGNYLASSDSRFKDFVCGLDYPVPIHDRWEKC